MTDSYHSLTVVLDRNVRVDDAEVLMAAIQQLRGVQSVTGHVADYAAHMAQVRADEVWTDRLVALIREHRA